MRRRALLAAGAALLPGCSALTDRSTPTERPTPTATPAPTLPLTPEDPADAVTPRGVEVRSERDGPTFATVVVEHEGRTLYVASDTVAPGETWRHDELVARPGVYRVVVEAATGERAVHGWVVGSAWPGENLVTRLTPGAVETEQTAICAPDCPPLVASGESRPLPRENPTDPGREVAGAVTLRNDRPRATPVSLRAADGDGAVLDYTYRLPAGVGVVVPLVRSTGTYDLRVAGPDRTVERPWHVPEEEFVRFVVGDEGLRADCAADETRVTAVSNAGDDRRSVGVALRGGAGGRSRAVSLAPGETRRVGLATPDLPAALSVFVDGSRRLTARWSVCPGGSLRVLLVGDTVFVRTDDRVVASAFAET